MQFTQNRSLGKMPHFNRAGHIIIVKTNNYSITDAIYTESFFREMPHFNRAGHIIVKTNNYIITDAIYTESFFRENASFQ